MSDEDRALKLVRDYVDAYDRGDPAAPRATSASRRSSAAEADERRNSHG